MSLQVWLPLNGNLENQGLDDVTVTNNGATVDTSGKIGSCYSFDGSDDYIQTVCTDYPSIFKGDFSIVFWVYNNDSGGRSILFGNYSLTGSWFNIEKLANEKLRFYWNDGAPDWRPSNASIPVGVWSHVVFTRKGNDIKFYIDGVLTDSLTYSMSNSVPTTATTFYAGRDARTGATTLNGKLNDLRIYDHCLSPKEVKELSKGLVAHYPLNDGVGGENILSVTPRTHTATAYNAYQFNLSENLVAGQTYTIQLWDVNVSHASKSVADLGVDVYWGGGSVRLYWWHGTSYFTDGHADHLQATFTVTEANASGSGATNAWLNIYNSVGYVAADMNMEIGKWKLEKGSVVTPWIPAKSDALYSAMGLDDGVIYDTSGYGRNGTNNGTDADADSPRYSISTKFDGTNYITLTNGSFPTVLSNDFTLSMWIHSDDDGDRSLWFGNYSISGGGNFFGFEKTTGNKVRFWWNNGNPDKTFGATSVTKSDGWVLLTLVKEGNVAKIYRNGVLSESNTNNNYGTISLPATATTFGLGADGRTTGNTLYKGSMSDVRIYATALSADGIKELYETSASVDTYGNFWGYEVEET